MKVVYYPYGTTEPIEFGADSQVQVTFTQGADLFFGGLPQIEMQVQLHTDLPITPQKEERLLIFWDPDNLLSGYIKEVHRVSEKVFTLVARSRLESMQTYFMGGFYQDTPFHDLATSLLDLFGYSADSGVSVVPVTGYLPYDTRAETLKKLAFASGGCLLWDRDGLLRFCNLWQQETRKLPANRVLSGADIRYLPAYTHYEVGVHSYSPGQYEVTIKDREERPPKEETFTFHKPYSGFWTPADPIAQIVDEGPNFVTIAHTGLITLRAVPYVHDTTYLSCQAEQTEGFSNKMTVWDNPLIQSHNAQQVLNHMQKLGQLRQELRCKVLVRDGEQLPWVGDHLEIPTPWGTKFSGYVRNMQGQCAREDVQMELILCGKETQ